MSRRNILLLGLLTALSLGVYLLFSWRFSGLGFPLDDAWIHQTYARNLALHRQWAFFPGQPSGGSTAPLWSAALALGHWLGLAPYAWTYFLGWLLLWALAVLGGYAMHWLLPDQFASSWWVGALLAFEWHLVWAAASGMETLLFALLVTLVLVMLVRLSSKQIPAPAASWFVLGLLVGLSTWVRPEGITLIAPLVLGALLPHDTWISRWRAVAPLFLGFLLLFVPYLLFNRAFAGAWWPNTFYAKQAEYAILRQGSLWRRLGGQFLLPLVGVGALLLPGFVRMLNHALCRRNWGVLLVAAWIGGHLVLYALRLPVTYQHGRYIIPAMPVYFILGLAGLFLWARSPVHRFWDRIVRRAWLLSTASVLLVFWVIGADAYRRDVAFIESEMVTTARWLAQHTAPDDLIAAHDIGALGYFAARPLLDLAGLVSPEVIPFIRDEVQLARYLDAQGARYLVTFPSWYLQLVQRGGEIFDTQGEIRLALGMDNMVVYRWSSP